MVKEGNAVRGRLDPAASEPADLTVRIDRVLYGRRDYLALLFGDRLEDE